MVNFTGSCAVGSLAMVAIDDSTSTTLRGREVSLVAA
jgi:hypothetical protein